jgi:hypothetical protein
MTTTNIDIQERAFGRVFCWVAAKLEVIAEDIGADNIASI